MNMYGHREEASTTALEVNVSWKIRPLNWEPLQAVYFPFSFNIYEAL